MIGDDFVGDFRRYSHSGDSSQDFLNFPYSIYSRTTRKL